MDGTLLCQATFGVEKKNKTLESKLKSIESQLNVNWIQLKVNWNQLKVNWFQLKVNWNQFKKNVEGGGAQKNGQLLSRLKLFEGGGGRTLISRQH